MKSKSKASRNLDFSFWRHFPTIKIWEAAVLMCGGEPSALEYETQPSGNPSDLIGEPLDFSSEIRMLISAVATKKVDSHPSSVNHPDRNTEIVLTSLVDWLRTFGDDYHFFVDGFESVRPQERKVTSERETSEERQNRRLTACEAAGLPMPSTSGGRLPHGIGKLAQKEGITRQAFTKDVKVALDRRNSKAREGIQHLPWSR